MIGMVAVQAVEVARMIEWLFEAKRSFCCIDAVNAAHAPPSAAPRLTR